MTHPATRKAWQYLDDEQCENCGSDLQVLTASDRPGWLYDGDVVRCTECYCQGWMDVAAEDAVSVQWPDDPCAKCYRRVEA